MTVVTIKVATRQIRDKYLGELIRNKQVKSITKLSPFEFTFKSNSQEAVNLLMSFQSRPGFVSGSTRAT